MQQNQQKVKQILNATIVIGQYTDRQSGKQKKSYLTIGTLFIYQDGMSLKLDALPTNGQNIVFYPRKPKEQNQANQNYNNNNGGNGQPHYNQNNNNYGGNNGY